MIVPVLCVYKCKKYSVSGTGIKTGLCQATSIMSHSIPVADHKVGNYRNYLW